MKPICVTCSRTFRVIKVGFYFCELMKRGDQHVPYRIWSGDVFECPGCQTQIISGTGLKPIAEHHEPTFRKTMENLRADDLQVE